MTIKCNNQYWAVLGETLQLNETETDDSLVVYSLNRLDLVLRAIHKRDTSSLCGCPFHLTVWT